MKKNKRLYFIAFCFIFICFFTACSTTKNFKPNIISNSNMVLENLPLQKTTIIVNDKRLAKADDDIAICMQEQLTQALSKKDTLNDQTYTLTIDIIAYKSFFTFAEWNAELALTVNLKENNTTAGSWEIEETAKRSNVKGYTTAKEVSQDVYEKAVAKLIVAINNSTN